MIKGVIFDLDGTLLNTLEDIGDSLNRTIALKEYGPHDYEAVKGFIGNGARQIVLRSLPDDIDEITVNELLEIYLKDYASNLLNKTSPYKGMHKVVKKLIDNDIKVSILSNKPHDATLALVEKCFEGMNFITIMGAKSEYPHKPDPTTALIIADKMKLDPKNIAFIGDSNVDVITSKNAHMQPIAVSWGFNSRECLEKESPDFIADNCKQLLDYLIAES